MGKFITLSIVTAFCLVSFADVEAAWPMKTQTASESVALYTNPQCPHCMKVKAYLSQIHKTLPTKDTSNPAYRDELVRMGQKGVPVLVVGSQVISGADAIISYLKQHPEVLR